MMMHKKGLLAAAIGLVLATASTTTLAVPAAKHVLLISVDGMHQSDLDWYVAQNPGSTLATLAA